MQRLVGLALLLAAGARSQPAALSFTSVGRTEGLSGRSVTALAVDSTGFVWFGTDGAVDRYDGVRVRPQPIVGPTGTGYFRSLVVTADGAVWAGNDRGLWRRAMSQRAFTPVRLPQGRASDVRALAVSGEAVWVATAGGLFRVASSGAIRPVRALASDTVRALVALPGGSVVAATRRGIAWVSTRHPVQFDRSMRDITALVVAGGRVVAGRESGGLVVLRGGPRRHVVGPMARVTALAASRIQPGRVWVGLHGSGVRHFDVASGTLREATLASDGAAAVERGDVFSLQESGGVLWVGTLDGAYGLEVEPPRLTSVQTHPAGPLSGLAVMAVHVSRHDPAIVWASTTGGGLHRIDRRTGQVDQWFGGDVRLTVLSALYESESGDLWMGGRSNQLWRLQPETGETTAFALGAMPGGLVNSLAPSRRHPGHLWVSTSEAGLLRFDIAAGRVVERYAARPRGHGIDARNVWQTLDLRDTLWVATDEQGLWWLDQRSGRAGRLSPGPCAVDDGLLSVAAGMAGSIWVGGRAGRLVRLDRRSGHCEAFAQVDGIPADPLAGLFADTGGYVWLSTNVGLFRVDPRARAVTPFGVADGLPSTELYWYARGRGRQGEIAVGGVGGLVVFDPRDIRIDRTPAPVEVTGVWVDGQERPVGAGAVSLDLPHDENDISFEYSVLDLRRPATARYRVRLRGAADRWEAAGPETRYRALAPGRYAFEVQATNRDGYWSPVRSVPVRIRPPFWWTVPFWVLVIAGLSATGYAAHRYRVRQIERVERTRRRIADDLHDGIGSKISGVALRLDLVGRAEDIPEAARRMLTTLAGTARSVVDDLRDTVWLVDAEHDDLASVVARMERFAETSLGVRGTIAVPDEVPPTSLSMEARRDLYFLFTEAVHNAIRHAHATRVDVRIEVSGRRVGFAVEDDGTGFDPSTSPAGRGLSTMAQRASALGGVVQWHSRPEGGTSVQFETTLG